MALALLSVLVCWSPSAAVAARGVVAVDSESELRAAWEKPRTTRIEVERDITLHACGAGDPIRESAWPILVEGNGHVITQSCFEQRLLRQDGTGLVQLRDIWLRRGGSDGPGAAVTTRGEIEIYDSKISQNLAEEPGGGVFSMRRATIVRSVMTGNLANDDGGAVYARRGGVRVVDSKLNANLVDGSGGAIGSTGDIVVVRSHVDGNTTDGDGGAIYTDEDGDVTVIDSTVDGSTADGPGGAIFTLDGDVTVVGSTLNGNRADDRGGAISGEADVTLIDSTVARNAAVAHVGGGVWARGDLYMAGSTVSNNYAEGQGGGAFAAGSMSLAYSTVSANVAPVASNIGAGDKVSAFASIIGPPREAVGGGIQPTGQNCRIGEVKSLGFNIVSDNSCPFDATSDRHDIPDLALAGLGPNGGFGETHMPMSGSPALNVVPVPRCKFTPFGKDAEGDQHLAGEDIDPLAEIVADQRGAARPFGAGCDSGSVEAGGVAKQLAPGPAVALPFGAKSAAARRIQPVAPPPATDPDPVSSPRGTAPRAADASLLERARRSLNFSKRALEPMTNAARSYRRWSKCLGELPVSERGADGGTAGFSFDGLDGAGKALRPALARDPKGRSDYTLLTFSRRKGCKSAHTVNGGTADPARAVRRAAGKGGGRKKNPGELARLQRKLDRLDERVGSVLEAAARFDRWESCLGALGVTEEGDPAGQYGFEYISDRGEQTYRAALGVDRSAWDDPDYQVVTTRHRSREGLGRCAPDPGEGVDRALLASEPDSDSDSAANDLLQDAHSLREDVEDAAEPIFEFESFDQCMYTLGLTLYGSRHGDDGYIYKDGRKELRPALAVDIGGLDPPQFDVLVSPGEEPPQIECNEDASAEIPDD